MDELQQPGLPGVAEDADGVLRVAAAADVDRAAGGRAERGKGGEAADAEANRVGSGRRASRIDRRQPGHGSELDAGKMIAKAFGAVERAIDTALNVRCQ